MPRGRKKGTPAVKAVQDYIDENGDFHKLPAEDWDYTGCVEWKESGVYARGNKTMVVTPKGVDMCRKLRGMHYSQSLIAHWIGTNQSTLNHAINRQPELKDAMEAGQAVGLGRLTQDMVRAANAGFAPALFFMGKTLYGLRENDTPQTNVSNVTIQLPASMSLEQMRQLKSEGLTVNQLPMPNFDELGDELQGEVVYAEGQPVPDDKKH